MTPPIHADTVIGWEVFFVRHWSVAILLLAPVGLTAQVSSVAAKPASAATVKTWILSRTVDGQPDLQGTWTNATNVPLERPAGLGGKEFYLPKKPPPRKRPDSRAIVRLPSKRTTI